MRPAELFVHAIGALACDRDTLVLAVPRQPTGNTMRLFGKAGGPLCEILCVNAEGETVVAAEARKVADWLVDRGAVEVLGERDGKQVLRDAKGELELTVAVRQEE